MRSREQGERERKQQQGQLEARPILDTCCELYVKHSCSVVPHHKPAIFELFRTSEQDWFVIGQLTDGQMPTNVHLVFLQEHDQSFLHKHGFEVEQ